MLLLTLTRDETMKRFLFLLLLFAPGVAAQPFDGLSEAISNGEFGNLKAVVISRHGEVIYEQYFRGTSTNDLHQVQSVTKSVGSALVGIVVGGAEIALLPVSSWLASYSSQGGGRVRG